MQLDDQKIELFRELINIGVGKASATLNQLLNSHVYLTVPNIVILVNIIKNRIINQKHKKS